MSTISGTKGQRSVIKIKRTLSVVKVDLTIKLYTIWTHVIQGCLGPQQSASQMASQSAQLFLHSSSKCPTHRPHYTQWQIQRGGAVGQPPLLALAIFPQAPFSHIQLSLYTCHRHGKCHV